MSRMKQISAALAGLVLAAMACNLPVGKRASGPDATLTAAVLTVQVGLTGTAQVLSAIPSQPSETILPTGTLRPSNTPAPSNTPIPTTPVARCNWVQFVTDVSVPDGTQFTPGSTFTKTWRLKNTGTCTWSTDYTVSFESGSAMGAPATVPMPETVPPGDTIDVSVNLTAPTSLGRQTGYWKLRNPAGIAFGTGSDAQGTFYVQIDVVSGTATVTPTLTATVPGSAATILDLTNAACSAEWRSAAGVLPCPGKLSDQNGFVLKVDTPKLQDDNQRSLPGLETHPQWVQDGTISGRYPGYKVQQGDRFRAVIGCLSGATTCDARFQLNYRVEGGSLKNLGQWDMTYEEDPRDLNVDLSSLAGKNVELVLAVIANGSPEQDWAFWWQPRVVR